MAGEHKAWADLLAAIAHRNAPEIVKLGTELLEPRTSNSEDDLAYLTTVTAAAHVRMGEIAQAHSLLQAQWRGFNHAGQFDLALRELAGADAIGRQRKDCTGGSITDATPVKNPRAQPTTVSCDNESATAVTRPVSRS